MDHTPDEAIFHIPWGHHIVILGKCANNKEKNDVVARWTLEGNQQQPLGISTYRISDLLPSNQQISGRIHQLQQELERLRKLQQKSQTSQNKRTADPLVER